MSAGKNTEGIKHQFNFKTPVGSLINSYVYSNEKQEGQDALEFIADLVPYIQAVETLLNAQGVLKEALGATPVEQSAVKSAPASSGGKACKHGEMTFRNGTSAKGPWKGHFCPSPKGTPDQCEPQFIR